MKQPPQPKNEARTEELTKKGNIRLKALKLSLEGSYELKWKQFFFRFWKIFFGWCLFLR